MPEAPDLVILVFGMNQAGDAGDSFHRDITQIVETVRVSCPQTELLPVSCMLPNTDTVTFCRHKLAAQEEALYQMQRERDGVGVVPVHSLFAAMADKGKKFVDYISNNINHPNDFAVRVYAQAVLAALEG